MPLHVSHAGEDRLAEDAADWIVRLSGDDAADREAAQAGFDAWKRADPRHAAAAAGMEGFIHQAHALRSDAAAPTRQAARATLDTLLDPPAPRRRASRAKRAVAVLAVAIPALWAGLGAAPPWLADLHTATGEQRIETLADGSQLTLGTAAAVNVTLSGQLRRVELVRGEILVEVAKDASRPFVVDTPDGRIQARGTRFLVRRDDRSTLLTMLESRTTVTAAGMARDFTAGEQARLSAEGVTAPAPVDAGLVEEAFRHRRWVVADRPLPEVLDELARHRPGAMRIDRAALAGLRVSAVLPLDDPDRALQLLQASFPQLRLRHVTPWVLVAGVAS